MTDIGNPSPTQGRNHQSAQKNFAQPKKTVLRFGQRIPTDRRSATVNRYDITTRWTRPYAARHPVLYETFGFVAAALMVWAAVYLVICQ